MTYHQAGGPYAANDNVFSLADTPQAAVAILTDFEDKFKHDWGLRFGQDSKQILTPTNSMIITFVAGLGAFKPSTRRP